VLLINAALIILFLSDTYPGSTHDKRIAEATPYPLPAGSPLLQDLGFLALTLDQVEMLMPTKKPRGGALTRVQKAGDRRIARLRARIEHVTAASSVVASSTTPTASGKPVSAIWSWKSAVRCIALASV
jgi:DDE superfamily endonuclease